MTTGGRLATDRLLSAGWPGESVGSPPPPGVAACRHRGSRPRRWCLGRAGHDHPGAGAPPVIGAIREPSPQLSHFPWLGEYGGVNIDGGDIAFVRVLGPIQVVTTSGRVLDLPSASQRRLLARLAVDAPAEDLVKG